MVRVEVLGSDYFQNKRDQNNGRRVSAKQTMIEHTPHAIQLYYIDQCFSCIKADIMRVLYAHYLPFTRVFLFYNSHNVGLLMVQLLRVVERVREQNKFVCRSREVH